jgi:hypothetical protein
LLKPAASGLAPPPNTSDLPAFSDDNEVRSELRPAFADRGIDAAPHLLAGLVRQLASKT